jgi:arginyl-tRNA synthetase
MTIPEAISQIVTSAVTAAYPGLKNPEVAVKRTENPEFGDYQTEFAMVNARTLKKNPMHIAEAILAKIEDNDVLEKKEAVKPGFINFLVNKAYLEKKAAGLLHAPAQSAQERLKGQKILIDYSSPNAAKTMHIGHFRATVTGNAIYRILKFAGAEILSDNHLGDWGTQFGSLIVAFRLWKDQAVYEQDPLQELERLYQKFQNEKTPDLEASARQELVKLQQGEPDNIKLWQEFIRVTQDELNKIYGRLDVSFDYTLGESFYNDMLPGVVNELVEKGIAIRDQGAVIVDTDKRYQVHGPVIVEKKDGGFGYATTDLATIKYRLMKFSPEKIIYVTDSRQLDHFKSLFAVTDEWLPEKPVAKQHVYFGSVKAADGKSFSTREGNVVPLNDIINEAIQRAKAVVEEKNPTLPPEEKSTIAEVVGIGALKYSELNHDLKTDTVFDWDRMLSLEGNTAPYHLYTYARAKSVLRKHTDAHGSLPGNPRIIIQNEIEKKLIMLADTFPLRVMNAATDLKPNHITEYVHLLAGEFNSYYNRKDSIVVKEAEKELRESRVAVYMLVSELIKLSLNVLGIKVLERM